MKKTILGVATIALLLAGCSKNEITGRIPVVNDDATISFKTYTGSTKAADQTTKNLEAGFTVVATHTADGVEAERFSAIYNYTGGNWAWPATDAKYQWPTADNQVTLKGTYPMRFISFFPMPAGAAVLALATQKTVAIAIATTAETQVDYMYAYNDEAKTKEPVSGNAELTFKHILSKILFQVQASVGYKVNVLSIKVVNVANETSVATAPLFNAFTPAWENPITAVTSQTIEYVYRNYDATARATSQQIDGSAAAKTELVAGNSNALMLLPQVGLGIWSAATFKAAARIVTEANVNKTPVDIAKTWVADVTTAGAAAWTNSRIEVIYNIQDATDAYVVGGDKKFVRVGYPLDLTTASAGKQWLTGEQYTYTIQLGGKTSTGGILLDPFYHNETGVIDPANPEIVTNPKVIPGDNINNTSGNIGFNVGVKGWNTGTTTPIN